RRRIGNRGSGHAREHHARDDRHMREAAADVPDQRAGERQQQSRDAAGVHQHAGDEEERNREERERVDALDQRGRENVQRHLTAHREDERQGGEPHGEKHRHPQRQAPQERPHQQAERQELLQHQDLPRSSATSSTAIATSISPMPTGRLAYITVCSSGIETKYMPLIASMTTRLLQPTIATSIAQSAQARIAARRRHADGSEATKTSVAMWARRRTPT